MLHKLRQRMADERGFTLIELLVVILIIGILAAIALPAFLNQRAKAQDSEAKSSARTVQTAMETYYTDNQNYAATETNLQDIEPSIGQFADRLTVTNLNSTGAAGATGSAAVGYKVAVTSKSKDATVFSITVSGNGTAVRECDDPGKGGCPAAASGSTVGSW
jgi:type IV pilus assembly protein PilA